MPFKLAILCFICLLLLLFLLLLSPGSGPDSEPDWRELVTDDDPECSGAVGAAGDFPPIIAGLNIMVMPAMSSL